MADLSEAGDLLQQIQAENAVLSQDVNSLYQRVSNLAAFEHAARNETTTTISNIEELRVDQDLHKGIDLFTHFKENCPRRRAMGRFDRSWLTNTRCQACYDHSATMDSAYWQPANHDTTIQKPPELVKRETKALLTLRMGPVGLDGMRGRPSKVSKHYNQPRIFRAGNVVDTEFRSYVSRSTLATTKSVRMSVVSESSSDGGMSVNNKVQKKDGFKHDQDNRSGDAYHGDDEGYMDDLCGPSNSSEMDYASGQAENEESYRESSSPVKAWYMHPGRMGSTSE